MKKPISARIISVLLAASMTFNSIPSSAYAEESFETQETVRIQTTEDLPASESTEEHTPSPEPQTTAEPQTAAEPEPAPEPVPEEPVQEETPVSESVPFIEDTSAQDDGAMLQDGIESAPEETVSSVSNEDSVQSEAQSAAFEQSQNTEDIQITVKAQAGVFPAGTVLKVEKMSGQQLEEAKTAVSEAREEGCISATSYYYAIKILDADGNEIEPAEGQTAEVAFAIPEAADPNLDAAVYQITPEEKEGEKILTAGKLEMTAAKSEGNVRTETGVFPFFAVDFTYSRSQNELPAEGTSARIEVNAVSRTNNIVGDVFVNMINSANESAQDEIRPENDSLTEYPLDHHEWSYYGDSLRIRYLDGGDEEGPNYLVYRDSLLLIGEKEGEQYTVTFSEDGAVSYVTPAIPEELLKDKTGIVFLAQHVGYDNILVFDGAVQYDGDLMTVPLKKTEEITVNELFSDGKLVAESSASGEESLNASGLDDIDFNRRVSGTNWSAEITDFRPSGIGIGGSSSVDVWDLLFQVNINIKLDLDFKARSTGASNGLETRMIALLGFSVGLFDVEYTFNLQAQFDEHPIEVEGTLTTDFNYGIGTHGANINTFRTPVKIRKLTVINPEDYNKDIHFYIGSQLTLQGGFLSLKINLLIEKVNLGPVLSITQDSRGGCYITARHEKDQYDPDDLEAVSTIHTCARQGEEGCLDLEIVEKNRNSLVFTINLYFKKWSFTLSDKGEKTIKTENYYDSYTYGSGMRSGTCPHRFSKVPVNVWLDENRTVKAPEGIEVTVSEALSLHESEKDLAYGVTDSEGKTYLFLPVGAMYNVVASGEIDGRTLAGSSKTPYVSSEQPIRAVDVIMKSDEKVSVRTRIVWNVDTDKKDIPTGESALHIALMQREAGTNDSWQIDWSHSTYTDLARNWEVPECVDVPKFGFRNGKAYLYEYCIRIIEGHYGDEFVRVISPENGYEYIERGVDAYDDAVGQKEQMHVSKYHVDYQDVETEDSRTTTITATAAMDVRVRKLWKLTNPEDKPGSVWLALQQKPENGWASKAAERNVPDQWLPILNPLPVPYFQEDCSNTLRSLQDVQIDNKELVTILGDSGSIENTPLTIGEAGGSNSWTIAYTVPKYRNGIRMQYQGAELDRTVIENLLRYEYDHSTVVTVQPFGNYVSIPGLAADDTDIAKSANVINTDPVEVGTLMGSVRWQTAWNWQGLIPDHVDLHIFRDGVEIAESPLTLNKADYQGLDTWIWTLTPQEYDPEAVYTVKETIPYGTNGPIWVGIVNGLHVYNYNIAYDYLQCEVQAVFEKEPGQDEIGPVMIRDREGNAVPDWIFRLKKSAGWWGRDASYLKSDVRDISEYQLDAPEVEGYVRIYEEPYAYTRPQLGSLFYNFSVYYMLQNPIRIRITTEWVNPDGSPVDSSVPVPEQLNCALNRDDEKIEEFTLTKGPVSWSEHLVDQDAEGKPLMRLDENDNKHKYVYTIIPQQVEGFTTQIIEQDDTETLSYVIRNTWVGDDYVNVRGKVSWEGDEEKLHIRPETVKLSVINSKEEYVRTIEVPVNGDGTYEARFLPGPEKKDSEPETGGEGSESGTEEPETDTPADGGEGDGSGADEEVIKPDYTVLESHVDGYTTTYTEPVFDEETRTWICDVNNKLTGYFPLTIQKVIRNRPDAETPSEQFHFTVRAIDEAVGKDGYCPLPINPLTITGEGETTAEFLIDQNGVYLYSVTEDKGTNPSLSYDTNENLVLVARTEDEEGNVEFRSWVGVPDPDAGEASVDVGPAADESTSGGEETSGSASSGQESVTLDEETEPSSEGEELPGMDEYLSDRVVFTNSYPLPFSVKVEWEIDSEQRWKPGSVTLVLQHKVKAQDNAEQTQGQENEAQTQGQDQQDAQGTQEQEKQTKWETVQTAVVSDVNKWETSFLVFLEDGETLDDYRVGEIENDGDVVAEEEKTKEDKEEKMSAAEDSDSEEDDSDDSNRAQRASFDLLVGEDIEGVDFDVSVDEDQEPHWRQDNERHDVIHNDLDNITLTVEKEWVIDIEGNDKPEEIKAAIQRKKGPVWQTVEIVELNDDNGYRATKDVPRENAQNETINYRVRELKEDTILNQLLGKIMEYTSWLNYPRAQFETAMGKMKSDWSAYYKLLPDSFKDATKDFDTLAGAVGLPADSAPLNVYLKFLDVMNFCSAASRIVYDKGDKDRVGEPSEWNLVTYEVEGGDSALQGEVKDHTTEYTVKYETDGNTTRIENTAVLDIQNVKRWVRLGGDQPESAWIVLLCQPKEGMADRAQELGLPIDLNQLTNIELPVINPVRGGSNLISIISELAIGIDLNIFGSLLDDVIPKVAIAKVTEDDNWRKEYRVKKYLLGIPLQFKGAELVSEILRQIIKYVIHIDIPVSFNPIRGYISIPTRAIQSFSALENGLLHGDWSEVLDKAKYLTLDDLKAFKDLDPSAPKPLLFYDYELMTNVINVKFSFPTDDAFTLKGKKTWKDDDEKNRPDTIKIHIKDGDKEIKGSPVELKKSDFEGKNEWTWEIGLERPALSKSNYVASEEWPEEYQYKDNYTVEKDGLNLINTWHAAGDKVTVSGKKIWEDEDNLDGLRPKQITVHLYADGKEVAKADTSEAGEWKYYFKDLPKKNDKGEEIKYTLKEDAVEGYESRVDDYNIINTHVPEKITIEGSKTWEDDDNSQGKRPSSITIRLKADGEEKKSVSVSEADGWKWSFNDLPKKKNNKEISYTITEDTVDGYTSEVNGYDVTNRINKEPRKTQVTVSKVWKDEENQDGIRPESVTIRLLADGKDTGRTLNLSESSQWSGSFTDLDEETEDGQTVRYTVEEETNSIITGTDGEGTYAYAVTGDAKSGYTVTNTHTPVRVSIDVRKIWKDEDEEESGQEDREVRRPESITLRLKADGEERKSASVTEDDDWKWHIANLPKYKDGRQISYTITEDAVSGYTTEVTRTDSSSGDEITYEVTNTYTPDLTQVNVSKVWDDTENQDGIRPGSVTVKLLADSTDTGKTLELTSDNDWTGSFTGLNIRSSGEEGEKEIAYTVEEVTDDVITGTDREGTYSFEIAGDAKKGYTITNKHTPAAITVRVTKIWEDQESGSQEGPDAPGDENSSRPEKITLRLKADGEEIKSTDVTEESGWEWTVEDLPKYKDGRIISYTLSEDKVEDYTTEVTGPQEGESAAEVTFEVKNTYAPGKTQVTVSKVWDDEKDQDGIRPQSVTIRLFADGEDTGKTLELSEDNHWTGTFEDLDESTGEGSGEDPEGGSRISYTVEEEKTGVITGEDGEGTYADAVSGDADQGYTVTNTHTPSKTEVKVNKVWNDGNDQDRIRPESVTIKLFADGEDTGKKLVLSEENTWSGSFTGLIKQKDGEEIKYTVEEEMNEVITGQDADGTYASDVEGDAQNGYTITNTHTQVMITVKVRKTWVDEEEDDQGNPEGHQSTRPESITIRLRADGKEVDSASVTKEDGWVISFAPQPKYRDGKEITYTITEDQIEGYTSEINGFDVTNTWTPGKTQVQVTKVWEDADNQDGLRPYAVIISLLADGEDTGKTLTLSEDNSWTGSFTDLDVRKEGQQKDIVYTVTEYTEEEGTEEDDPYTSSITGDMKTGYTVTNTHAPEKISVTGEKTWEDEENQDGVRPESITIRLLADEKEVDYANVTEGDGWKWNFENLPKYEEGRQIDYTITEDSVADYTSEVEGYNVTNKHTPDKTQVTVTKVWEDQEDQDGIRPDTVSVKLLADGEETSRVLILHEGNSWTGTFDDLDVKKDGQEIRYTVEEILTAVVTGTDGPGTYAVAVSGDAKDGFTITNTHTPEKTVVEGSKTWEDNDDEEGVRPESITIRLKADGTEVKYADINEEDGWKWKFEDLPKYRNGQQIAYTITEDSIEDYTSEVDGFDVTNTHMPGKTQVTVTKVWNDQDDQDGIRPKSVRVKLLADSEETGKTITLTQDTDWKGTFTDLGTRKDDKEITYTVEEETDSVITGQDGESTYAVNVSGNAREGYTVTNTHTPQTIKVEGQKIWEDDHDMADLRPSQITIRLKADGKELDSRVVSRKENWKWSFENLPKYAEGKEVTYAITEDAIEDYTSRIDGYDVVNTVTPLKTSVTVTKQWNDADDQDGIRPKSVRVKLLADGADTGKTLTLSEDNSWTGTFTDLNMRKGALQIDYTIEEEKTSVITGTDGTGTYGISISGDAKEGYTVTNIHTPETISVEGSKTWVDEEDKDGVRPKNITIRLKADGVEEKSVDVTQEDGWKWKFENLPKYKDGQQIVYTITEDSIEDYTSEVDGFDVTNTHTPGKTQVTVTKVWNDSDDEDGIRPKSVRVKLLADSRGTGKTLELSEDNSWSGAFKDLEAKKDGKEINYTVVEETNSVITGEDGEGTYAFTVKGKAEEGFTITNTHTPVKTAVEGSKTWEDNDDEEGVRPQSITIRLKADGVEEKSADVTKEDGWKWKFENLPKYKDGQQIVYTITEDSIEDYTSEVDGYDVTNTHTPGRTQVTVTKVWNDQDDQDGIRPKSVRVKLLADGEETGKTLVLSEDNSWSGIFKDLEAKKDGKEINYTVEEETDSVIMGEDGEGTYAFTVKGSAKEGFTITNTHTPEKTAVKGSKTWEDNDDEEGVRPQSITIRLKEDGEEKDSKVVTKNDGWKWNFGNLAKYRDGKQIVYTITEDSVEDYTSEVDGFDVTNTHTPGKTQVTVTKVWNDSDDQDGIRPKSVRVKLLADGEETGKTLALSEDNGWSGIFKDLEAKKDGKEINYTVEEETDSVITGEDGEGTYAFAVKGSAKEGFTITNTHTPEKTAVEGSKTWVDEEDKDGVRPKNITIRLKEDGAEVKYAVVGQEDDWKWKFEDLPKYRDGKQIVYTITEDSIEGYTSEVEGFDVTNTYTPGKTQVTVTKVWNDSDDQDGIRPKSVRVKLLADGEETGKTLALSEDNSWSGAFKDLEAKKDGKEINYTVEEATDSVITGEDGEGTYAFTVKGNAEEGFTITNVHTPVKTAVEGSKTWEDNDDEEGVRPQSITIRLKADGVEVKYTDVTQEDGWKWKFKNLPKYKDGQQIVYTITEDSIEDYTSEVDGYDVTNTHTPGKTQVTVTKVWNDTGDQDGIRPDAVAVKLLADGTETSRVLVLHEGNNWTGSFKDLDKKREGQEIRYTVEENHSAVVTGTDGPGTYAVSVSGDAKKGFTITNIHTPERIPVEGSKTWEDNDDQDGVRPQRITIRLKADGTEVDSAVITKEDDWKWKFENLPKCKDGRQIDYTITEDSIEDYTSEVDGFDVTNTHTPDKTQVTVTKVWNDAGDQDGIRPDAVAVKLLADGTVTSRVLVLHEGNHWSGTFTNLDKMKSGKEIVYTVEENSSEAVTGTDGPGTYAVSVSGDAKKGFTITNIHTPEKTSVEGSKTWEDNDDQDGVRPKSIKIRLKADGAEVKSAVVTQEDDWKWKFEDLPKYKDGQQIVYTITEDSIEDYTSEVDGFDVTNTHTPEKTQVTVSKAWKDADDQDGIRPKSVTALLFADGEKTGQTLTLTRDNGWTGSFTDLDAKKGGQEIVYSVEEETTDVITGENGPGTYAFTVEGNAKKGFTITNIHTPEKTSVEGSKTWEDNDNQDGVRPQSIKIRLRADGTEVKSAVVTQEDDWKWKFENLPKNKNGRQIVYTITEDSIEDYTSEVDGYDVINTHTPDTTQVTVTKTWNDSDDQDGIRPDAVCVKLFSDGVQTSRVLVLHEGNQWSGTFTNLDKMKGGKEIVYTVEENPSPVMTGTDGPGTYACTVEGSAKKGYTITNIHTPETTSVEGSKTWEDNDDQDGVRPQSITIRLKADGTQVQSAAVTKEDDWKWSFANLPKYKNGRQIVYTIAEDTVKDYTTEVDGFDVTNTHTPEKTQINVTKVWNDSDDQDGIRPDAVAVKLFSDGVETSRVLVLNKGNNWTGTFRNLDEKKSGKEIVYTVEENHSEVVTGTDGPGTYALSISGSARRGFTITNIHTPEKTEVAGSKTWEDNDDQDGVRPQSITIRLKADGTEIGSAVVTQANGWKWNFANLPKYADGKEVVYSITEDSVKDYTSEVEDFDVINTHTPKKTQVTVTKVWKDADDQDGIRPASVVMLLLADGKKTGQSLVLTQEDSWTGSFPDLDEKKDGKEITYTVEEEQNEVITGEDGTGTYAFTVDGNARKGFTVTNIHTPEVLTVEGSKTWEDNDDQDGVRPQSITIRLKADGTEVKSAVITKEDDWKWKFENLPKYNDGKQIDYTITEDNIEDYTSEVNGFDVTNTHTPGKTQVTVTKVWNDEGDQDGIRPDAVAVKLMADGVETSRVLALNRGNSWTGTFRDLDEKKGGKKIIYTVEENHSEAVTGTDGPGTYAVSVSGNAKTGFTVTNTHTPETVSVEGSKIWEDNDNQDGVRPQSITIRLKADGIQVKAAAVTEADGWKWSFLNLAKYRNGKQIDYTITEDSIPEYTSEVDGYNVTNTHTPGKTQVTVTKAWRDAGNQDGFRPESVDLILYADGVETGRTLTLTAGDHWTGSFTDLDEKKDGKRIAYTVDEVKTDVITGTDGPGTYSVHISGSAKRGYTVVNTHTPQKIDIRGGKTWNDAEDQDGVRPQSITIRLMAGTEEAKTVTVTEADRWKWSFRDLPEYADGKKIVYTITEDSIPGYTSEVDGYDVTNTHTPEKMQVTVAKVWKDADDRDGIRPSSVTVILQADGVDTGMRITLSEENKWTDSFTDLDVYRNKQKIVYTVEEKKSPVITGKDDVGTYAYAVSGDAQTGFTVTNTHTPKKYTITYKLNGGSYAGSKADIKEMYYAGTEISIHEKPVRSGYTFLYWKGSQYQPGDRYTVTEDHTFTAQWEKDKKETETDWPDPDDPTGPTPKGTPPTGDSTPVAEWLMMLLLAAGVLLLLERRRRAGH